jgi:hypothetical protein
MALYIRLDKSYDIYERKVYSLLDLLGDIGGLKESVLLIGFLMVDFFSERLLVSSIMRKMY